MTQKPVKLWQAALLGACLGALVFLLIYGPGPLDPTNDGWIFRGYDENDIIQRYSGEVALLHSGWQFPLGQVAIENCLSPNGYGCNVAFADSIPIVGIFFKLFAPLLPQVFQYEGLYALAVFILQGISAGMLLSLFLTGLPAIGVGTMFFVLSPVLLERAFRHTTLGSHYLILFALYCLFRHRRDGRLPWGMVLLCGLTTGITPYFLPMVAMLALVLAIEHVQKTKRPLVPALFFVANCAAGMALAWAIGSVGSGYAASRDGYGWFSLNLNALINPRSCGGYHWSRFLETRGQLYGQYDGFSYLGVGGLLMLACGVALLFATTPKEGRRAWLRRNAVLLAGCVFLTAFAVSHQVVWEKRELFVIPLPQALLDLCGIFRASARLFYPVYYLLLLFGVINVGRGLTALGRGRAVTLALALLLAVQVYDLSDVLREKHEGMAEKLQTQIVLPPELVRAQQQCRTLFLDPDSSGSRRTLTLALRMGLVSNDWYANTPPPDAGQTAALTQQWLEELDRGSPEHGLDPTVLYTTDVPERWALWQELYADQADFVVLYIPELVINSPFMIPKV